MELRENDLVFAKVKEGAIIPSKEHENAGYDIYACFDEDFFVIPTLETRLVPTGIASAMHESKYLQVEERSSTGSRGVKKSAGVIDSGYRGEILVAITNCNNRDIVISKTPVEKENKNFLVNNIVYPYSKAIAQLVVHEVPKMDVQEVAYEELQTIKSDRGLGMLGSSKK